MSQISDVGGGIARAETRASKPVAPAPLQTMTDAMLADEHRGQSFAKQRVADRLAAIEAELERRGLTTARGTLSIVTKHENEIGLVDLKRLRAERPDLCRVYAKPGSDAFWRSRTLTAQERT